MTSIQSPNRIPVTDHAVRLVVHGLADYGYTSAKQEGVQVVLRKISALRELSGRGTEQRKQCEAALRGDAYAYLQCVDVLNSRKAVRA